MNRHLIIFNLFIKNKIRTRYEAIFKLLKIKKAIPAYTILMIGQLIVIGIMLLLLFQFFSVERLKTPLFYLSSLLLFGTNANLWVWGNRYVTNPKNTELLTMTGVGDKKMFTSLLSLEYLWVKTNNLDKVVPAVVMLIFLLGARGIVWIVLLEFLSIALCLLYSKKRLKVNSGRVPLVWDLSKFILVGFLLFSTTYYIVDFLAKSMILISKNLNFSRGVNELLEAELKVLMDTEWSSIFHHLHRFNVGMQHFLYGNIIFLVLVFFVLAGIVLMATIMPNYRIPIRKVRESKLSKWYLGFLKKQNRSRNFDFLIEKDLRLLGWGAAPFSKVVLPIITFFMDYVILSAFYLAIVKYCHNAWLIALLTVFFFGNQVMNQVFNITSNLKSVFRMQLDLPLMDLYKIAGKTIKDVYRSKLSLCRLFLKIPLLLYGILTAIASIIYIKSLAVLILTLLAVLLFSILLYYFAPELSLYMSPLLCSTVGDKESAEQIEETMGEETLAIKFYETPKKALMFPLTFLLLGNAVVNLIPPGAWKFICVAYVIYMLLWILVQHKAFQKIVDKGVNALYGNKKAESSSP
ncbi:hypothetical protein FACS1894111_00070 [Clostridia bacterium]|nr:hypothetical protein FACS1894111_00070 [Clostridia bacterium]